MKIFLVACVFLVSAIDISLSCECGFEGATSRIFKGSAARPNKYPWLVQIRVTSGGNLDKLKHCGGTLIDDRHVATSARCVTSITPAEIMRKTPIEEFRVYLGQVAMSDETEPLRVTQVWFDPNFTPNDGAFDFAIVTLAKPVEFNQKVGPICLPNKPFRLSKLQIAGWGSASAGSEKNKQSDKLNEAEVDLIDDYECMEAKKSYYTEAHGQKHELWSPPPNGVTEICAINKATKADTCNGDFGGPLMHKGNNGLYYLVGVSSGGWTGCGTSKNAVGLYTRINYYRRHIEREAPNACFSN